MASINLSSFAGAGAQFFDNNGDPLTGGLLYVYIAGTTTPATTFTTSAGTVNNTNPIVLDSAGRTSNEIWVNGGVLYKFVLKTSTGVTIGTYDNIPSIDDPTAFNNLITVTGTNTLIGASTPPNTAYARGMTLSFVVVNTNTGAVTIDVDGLGAKEITFAGSTPLIAGQMTIGAIVTIEYDGTRFQLMNSSGALAITASSINGGQIAGFRNRIINGSMGVSQRGTSFSNPASGEYTLDRWVVTYDGTSAARTISQQPFAVGSSESDEAVYFLQFLQSIAGSGATYNSISTRLENVRNLASKTVTLSFTARFFSGANVLRSIVLRQNFGSGGSASVDTAVATNLAISGTFARYSITVSLPSILGKTVGTSNYLELLFFLPNNQVFTFEFSDVQLEAGAVATPFERLFYSTNLALCQRYYEATGLFNVTGYATSGTDVFAGAPFMVPKRVIPTLTFAAASNFLIINNSTQISPDSVTSDNPTGTVAGVKLSKASGITAGVSYRLLSGVSIYASAEL